MLVKFSKILKIAEADCYCQILTSQEMDFITDLDILLNTEEVLALITKPAREKINEIYERLFGGENGRFDDREVGI